MLNATLPGLRELILFALCAGPYASLVFAQPSEAEDSLTLPEALAIALEQSPALEAYAWETRAAEARILQASLRPNPELEFEIENLRVSDGPDVETRTFDAAGTATGREVDRGPDSGLGDDSEFTLVLSQVVELGGKRAKRVLAGEGASAVAEWDYEVARANVLGGVAIAFIEAFAAQVNVGYAENALNLANEVHSAIAARVEAGRNSPIDASRARLELTTAEIAVEDARRQYDAARVTLAGKMGQTSPAFGPLAGDVADLPPVPSWTELQAAAADSPYVRRWRSEIAHRGSVVELERARRWPDLTIGAGWRATRRDAGSFREFDPSGTFVGGGRSSSDDRYEHSFLVSFSLPIPLFDRNQGKVREAEYLESKARAETRAAQLATESALYAAWQRLSAAEQRVEALRGDIAPNAESVFESTNEGYRAGKFEYLDLLNAQRTLFETQTRLAAAYADFYTALVDLERLAGTLADLDATSPSQE